MLIEFFILFQIIMLGTFFTAFFTHEEILWAISSILSGALCVISYNVQFIRYVFDSGTGAYITEVVSYSYPVLMGMNFLFFSVAIAYGLYDLFEKWGITIFSGFKLK